MSRATIRKAVEWIASSDGGVLEFTDDDYDVESVSEQASVGLTAHLFGVDATAVATAVVARRAETRAKAALAALKPAGK